MSLHSPDVFIQPVAQHVEVPPLVVTETGDLPHRHRGSIHVEGASVHLRGTHQGSLWLHDGAVLSLSGTHQGSLHISAGCKALITGMQQGSVHVDAGGVVEIEGTHQGSVHNFGRYEVRGIRGGSLHGPGEYIESTGCRIAQPKVRNGTTYYEW
jgi:hypothetical protein